MKVPTKKCPPGERAHMEGGPVLGSGNHLIGSRRVSQNVGIHMRSICY